jgi:DNA-binding CsgD family transcriptional regulator
MSQGTDVIQLMQNYNKNSISVRKKIINQLRKEGLNDFQISLVLNTSEYQVKKLRREL